MKRQLIRPVSAIVLLIALSGCQFRATPNPAATVTAGPAAPTLTATNPARPTAVIQSPLCQPDPRRAPDQAGLNDPYFPAFGNGGYDVQNYDLRLDVDVEKNSLQATAIITARAVQDMQAFNLDFGRLTVQQVLVDGKKAGFRQGSGELAITPPEKIAANSAFTVEVQYQGSPQSLDAGQGLEMGWNRYETGIYVASEPAGSAMWYPVNDHPCDKAAYTYRVTVPKPYMVVANGLQQSLEESGEKRTYTWSTPYPLASYLATIEIAKFDEEKQSGPNGLLIRNYYEQSLESAIREPFRRTPEMIAFYESIFGPYPFEAYGVVVLDASFSFALETQTLSLFSRGHSAREYLEQVAAHELAHQWFGDSVSLKSWKDIWLNEGFASYAQWLWLEHSAGRQAYERLAQDWYTRLKDDPTLPGDPTPDQLFDAAVYYRGALALHTLRGKLGDEVFFRVLKTYYTQYQYANANTGDFIAVAEQVSGQQLDEFFQAWLYQPDLPALR